MPKIKVNYRDLKDALTNHGLLDYKDDPANFSLEISVSDSNSPGDGNMVDVLTMTLDKKEQDYSGHESDVRKIVEIFSEESGIETRMTTQKTTVIKKKRHNDDVPF